jgi:hypothetical protein
MTTTTDETLVAEDLLLLLLDPRSGTIAGEGTLFYVLAGAVLADLALRDAVELDEGRTLTGRRVSAVPGAAPSDPLLREVWDQVAERPQGVQALLAGVGPQLRGPLLERLVDAGHVTREKRTVLGPIRRTALVTGSSGRREDLVQQVRQVLVDGTGPTPRTGLLAALLSASGSLPALHADFPWSGALYTRGKELERGDWGAAAAGDAVMRTAIAVTTATTTNLVALGVLTADS